MCGTYSFETSQWRQGHSLVTSYRTNAYSTKAFSSSSLSSCYPIFLSIKNKNKSCFAFSFFFINKMLCLKLSFTTKNQFSSWKTLQGKIPYWKGSSYWSFVFNFFISCLANYCYTYFLNCYTQSYTQLIKSYFENKI